jgi:hypothetical protein
MNPNPPLPAAVLAPLGEAIVQTAQALSAERGLSDTARLQVRGLEDLGRELQTLLHALGAGAHECEAVPLLDAALATRRLCLPELARRGLRLTVEGVTAQVQADPAQLQHALDLLVQHGMAAGVDLRLNVRTADDGVAELLLSGAGAGPDAAQLHGQLLRWLGRSLGWGVQREPDAAGWRLRLRLGTAPAAAIAPDGEGLPRRHWAGVDRALIIDPDERTRGIAAQLLRLSGVNGDCVATLAQAEAALADGVPRAVVCGYPWDDPAVQALRDVIQAQRPGLRWVELVNAPFVFAAGSDDGSQPARISRHDLANTLLPSLAD